ncbi:transcriptional regulator [Liquorilactobacillus satsumensis]|uniref:DNA-binding protein n=1 Tax=Liquorilactobacillus satsumensis DSM 16230 = JCM 12392 TaxID=1423801 RepID=A0A0R1UVZ3_9LACO|nr:PAS domain-containing protein [Liquorilactobacillus satsumensis]KRL97182.1 hypothetical protein FD50_GL001737 [Liquorilactobacillus satsumensis DSM 16230 = JCM 12392]MCC7666833.1 hypothetical protein [Liquorilactobacillus satsumensis]MCP9311916.1 PAS domain-containing protein [Liquorilactobacillus satsumensis]MCP9328606.1 PAS domain-containing protein [Liquorilactobacillus satsumensis]MCP9356933.1 PAS domain-containing protein [Liquorilactobacillus satsumensis]
MKLVSSYIPLVDFLAAVLGPHTEIVLQDISQGLGSSVIYIRNGISGRKVGSPATDFLLEVLRGKIYQQKDYITNYRSQTDEGTVLYSSSFFIKDETGALSGMLCINSDKSMYLELEQTLEKSLFQVKKVLHVAEKSNNAEENKLVESLHTTVEEAAKKVIYKYTQHEDLSEISLDKSVKMQIVADLLEQGFFLFKLAIPELSKLFNMSEVSIYKYLQELKSK